MISLNSGLGNTKYTRSNFLAKRTHLFTNEYHQSYERRYERYRDSECIKSDSDNYDGAIRDILFYQGWLIDWATFNCCRKIDIKIRVGGTNAD